MLIAPAPTTGPSLHVFPLPNVDAAIGDLHVLLADLGIRGVSRHGGKTWLTFAAAPPLSKAREIVRRVRSLSG